MEVEKKAERRQEQSMLRKLAYLFMIIFFLVSSVAVYLLVTGLNATREAVFEPVGSLVRQLAIEVTPEIVPDPQIIVREVNELARLETSSVSLNQVITADRNVDLLWGAFGESLIFVAYGEVVAGIDLAKLGPSDVVVVDPRTVRVHLPEPEIFNAGSVLNTELSYIADRDEGIFTDADPQLETEVRRRAEAELLAAGLELGVLQMAEENAQSYLTEFLRGLGFTTIEFTDFPPPPAPPYEQDVPKGFVVTPVPGGGE